MSMRPKLWSLNALSIELGIDRRTLAAKLSDVPPNGKCGPHDAWRLTTVLAALGWGRPARTKGSRVQGNADYEVWRAIWMKQRALDAQREAKVREGQLTETAPYEANIKQIWINILSLVRTRFLAFPSKIAAHYPSFQSQADIFTWSTREVRTILQLLADGKSIEDDAA
jgi:hypothetical protein